MRDISIQMPERAENPALLAGLLKHVKTGTKSEARAGRISQEQSQSLYLMRGFAITIVVMAHVSDWPLRFAFFSMPLFFFISGYLFVPAKDLSAYFINITRKLMVPYFAFMAIIAAPNVTRLFVDVGAEAGWNQVGYLLLGGEQIKGIWAAYWYIPCFFFMHIAYTLCARKMSATAITWLCVPLWGLAIWNHFTPDFWLPLSINVVAMAFPIMHAGWLYRNREFSPEFDRSFHAFACVAGLAYTLPAAFDLLPGLQTKLAQYGLPVITVFCGTMMVIVTKIVSDRLRVSRWLNLTLGELGKASLIIMFAHQAIQMSIVSVFDVHNEVFRVGVSILASYALFRAMKANRWAGIIFLGKPIRSAATGPRDKPSTAPSGALGRLNLNINTSLHDGMKDEPVRH